MSGRNSKSSTAPRSKSRCGCFSAISKAFSTAVGRSGDHDNVKAYHQDGNQTKRTYVEQINDVWDVADRDENGTLSLEEIQVLCAKLNLRVPFERIENRFRQFDIDHNNELDYKEFVRFFSSIHSIPDLNDTFLQLCEFGSTLKESKLATQMRKEKMIHEMRLGVVTSENKLYMTPEQLQSFFTNNEGTEMSKRECVRLIRKYEQLVKMDEAMMSSRAINSSMVTLKLAPSSTVVLGGIDISENNTIDAEPLSKSSQVPNPTDPFDETHNIVTNMSPINIVPSPGLVNTVPEELKSDEAESNASDNNTIRTISNTRSRTWSTIASPTHRKIRGSDINEVEVVLNDKNALIAEAPTKDQVIDDVSSPNRLSDNVGLSYSGFMLLMTDLSFNQIGDPAKLETVCDDMTRPLSHYFISSSHNSYLTGNQLTSLSSTTAIERALHLGVRVIELDAWDGPKNSPIVTHGHTLCKPISFKDCLITINDHAFRTSEYPVIVTIENHCSWNQQQVQAELLEQTFGTKLYFWDGSDQITRGSVCGGDGGDLQLDWKSPYELRNRILVRDKIHNKKGMKGGAMNGPSAAAAAVAAFVVVSMSAVGAVAVADTTSNGKGDLDDDNEVGDSDSFGSVIDNDMLTLPANGARIEIVNEKEEGEEQPQKEEEEREEEEGDSDLQEEEESDTSQHTGVHPNLKRLMYIHNVPLKMVSPSASIPIFFNSGETCDAANPLKTTRSLTAVDKAIESKPYDGTARRGSSNSNAGGGGGGNNDILMYVDRPQVTSSSIVETKMMRLTQPGYPAAALSSYTKRHLVRVYPTGTRVTSSNYDPVPAWNAGCQLVALNYQYFDQNVWLNHGRFRWNRHCGYVLKPAAMLNATTIGLLPADEKGVPLDGTSVGAAVSLETELETSSTSPSVTSAESAAAMDRLQARRPSKAEQVLGETAAAIMTSPRENRPGSTDGFSGPNSDRIHSLPWALEDRFLPRRKLRIKLLSGHYLPAPRRSVSSAARKSPYGIRPFVQIDVRGVGPDNASQVSSVQQQGFDPQWNHEFEFELTCSELALVMFKVYTKTKKAPASTSVTINSGSGIASRERRDSEDMGVIPGAGGGTSSVGSGTSTSVAGSKALVGQAVLPADSIRSGLRVVPLEHANLLPVDFAYLFVQVDWVN